MTKAALRKQRREAILSANNEIYANIGRYLMGPKWTGAKYQVGDICSKSRSFGIIKVNSGYLGCKCSIYFDRDIRVFIMYRHHSGFEREVNYHYFKCDSDYMNLPEDMDDYVFRAKTFLKELLRHVSYLNGFDYSIPFYVNDYSECVDIPKPENFDVPFGKSGLALYEYNSCNPEIVDYMIQVMKSKKFKRYRGDNK